MKDVFLHPTALVESEAIGRGTRVWAYAHILAGATVGAECNLGDHVFIEGGASIGDRVTIKNGVAVWEGVTLDEGVFVGPGVVFTNDRYPRSPRLPEAAHRYTDAKEWYTPTRVGRGATLGAGSIILAGVTIHEYATVGAGALVTRDVPAHALVLGSPAEVRGWMCRCGLPLDLEGGRASCGGCGTSYEATEEDGSPRLRPVQQSIWK